MISQATIFAFAVAAFFTLIVPIALLVILAVRKKISWRPLLLGMAAFFVSQLVLRIPLMSVLSGQEWYQAFAEHYYLLFVLLVCLSAGIFEESARLGGALILKKHRSFKDIMSFGLGHAFCEVILLIGITQISNIVLCLTINNFDDALVAALPAETLDTIITQLTAIDPVQIYLGILERFSAVLFHLFATVLVFTGVIEKKLWLYGLAILAHTFFNFISVVLIQYAGIVVAEAALLIMALAAGYYTLWVARKAKQAIHAT